MPECADLIYAWEDIVEGLFEWLRDALMHDRSLDFETFSHNLDTWRDFRPLPEKRERWQHEFEMVYRILWCAEQAAKTPQATYDQFRLLMPAITSFPSRLKWQEYWAFDCVRSLRKADVPFRTLSLPVVVVDERGSDQSIVCTLVLDLLKPGGGRVFQHPQDILPTNVKRDFRQSLK
jgi:hypothetical protein